MGVIAGKVENPISGLSMSTTYANAYDAAFLTVGKRWRWLDRVAPIWDNDLHARVVEVAHRTSLNGRAIAS